jgi:3-deoxy-D-manno-octulosonate 8-phosphate phosphatase (KDO 8-P phosphatase)
MFDLAASRRIKLVGFDVDGVLTDNALFLGMHDGQRVELKRFDVQDGVGFALLRESGIDTAWVSGRVSEATILRGNELQIPDVIQVPAQAKVPAIEALLDRKGLSWAEMAFVGDDFADLPVFAKVGLPIAVANARDEVKQAARHVTDAAGGHGAAREVVERLLRSRGSYEATMRAYLSRDVVTP